MLAGLVLDLVDLSTAGPLGMYGLPVGAALVWWFAGAQGLRGSPRLWTALAAGLYCALPLTEWIPLGTALGAYLALRGDRRTHRRQSQRDRR